MFSIVLSLQASKPFVVENLSLRKKPTTICADPEKKSNGDRVLEIFKFAGRRGRGSEAYLR